MPKAIYTLLGYSLWALNRRLNSGWVAPVWTQLKWRVFITFCNILWIKCHKKFLSNIQLKIRYYIYGKINHISGCWRCNFCTICQTFPLEKLGTLHFDKCYLNYYLWHDIGFQKIGFCVNLMFKCFFCYQNRCRSFKVARGWKTTP